MRNGYVDNDTPYRMNIFEICAIIAELGLIRQLGCALNPHLPTSWWSVVFFFVLSMVATVIKYSYEEYRRLRRDR